jgi:hypothetical protein
VKIPKEKLTVWVSPEVAKAVKSMAAAQAITASQMAAQLLELGSKDQAELAGIGLLVPALEGAIRRESRALGDRLAKLLAVSALESATTRRMVYPLLLKQLGVEQAKGINNSAYLAAVERLKKPVKEVFELAGVDAGVFAATDPASDQPKTGQAATGHPATDQAAD